MNPAGIDANESVAYRSSGPLRLTHLQRYGLAVLSEGTALGLALLLQHFHFRDSAVPLLLFAVAISSWYGGPGPALLAFILSTISFYWYFVEPVRTIYIYPSDIPFFITFAAFAALLSWFGTIRRRGEADLRERAALLNLTHDTVFVMDMDGVIKFWNRAAEDRYGWIADQAVGKVVHDLLKTVFPAPLEEIKAELTRTGRWEGEVLHCKKDGSQLVAASRWSLERGKRGEPVAILETNNDITERKRAEDALRRLNRELRAISNCNQALLRSTDEQSLLEKVCRTVCEEAGYVLAWVGYAEHDDAKSVRPVAWTGAEEGYLASTGITWADTDRGRGQTGTAIRSGKTCCIQDFATDPRLAPWREGLLHRGFHSGIALPLKDEHGNAFGSLTIHSAQPNAFTPEEAHLLEELAADLAFGIVTLRSRAARKRAEEGVTLLSFALNNVREAAILIDERARIQYVNDETCRVLGYTRAELLGKSVLDIDPEFPAERWSDHWRDLQEQRSLSFESRHRTKDRRIFPVEISANYFEYGGRAYNLSLVRDITERKQAEDALRQSEAYLAEAQRLSHTGSWALDASTREYSYWSDEMFQIFGVDPHGGIPIREAMGRRIHPEDASRATAGFEKSLREKVDTSDEYRFVLLDGTVKHIQSIRHPVLNDAGDVVQLVGTFVDITERKEAEEALRESETRFRTFVDHAADEFFVLDFERGTIIDVNRSACESLGYTRQELIGKTPLAFDVNLDPAAFESISQRAAAGETVLSDRHWHRRKDGSTFPVEVNTSVFWYRGRRFLVKAARDISDRRQAEEQRDKLRQLEADLAHINRVSMMGELTASIAHEVNQPLSGVVSNASACLRWLAGDRPNLEEAREAARRIVRDGKRAAEVVARVRAMTRRTEASREKLDLNETIREVLALVGDEAKKNSVVIRTGFADDAFPVLGDRVQLQQVMLNLVMNGIEAMSSVGEKARELAITTRNTDSDQVQVTVQDSGKGLDPDTMPKIFEPFYTTKPSGMGMGLSISRSILQAHGGQLWAAANEGPGTSFHFTLPRYEEESHDAA